MTTIEVAYQVKIVKVF